jgi:sugar (pentulose or hexulose) kinase
MTMIAAATMEAYQKLSSLIIPDALDRAGIDGAMHAVVAIDNAGRMDCSVLGDTPTLRPLRFGARKNAPTCSA